MSWDGYLDNLVGHAQGNCVQAAIMGQDGSRWTAENHKYGLPLRPNELTPLVNAFKSRDFNGLYSGVYINGTQYMFLREMDSKVVMAKKKGQGFVTIQKTGKAIVIGRGGEGQQQGMLNTAVAKIADYLESLGY